jgi:hypothetical protein
MNWPVRRQMSLSVWRFVAISEWLMVLPAAFFLVVAALRLLQPREFQPASLCWQIFEWTMSHVSESGAAILFLVLPAAAAAIGFGALLEAWGQNASLRHDVFDWLGIVRRNAVTGMVLGATLVAALICAAAVLHLIMG